MEVSTSGQFDTHVVIGGGAAEVYSTADTAEFYTMMSDTLYRDKRLALVREVMCNAWDAHIASGRTDKAIRVDISDTEMTFQDFGYGISHERIVPIYCKYGASTKVQDTSQTGGFGLGSKAPYAYSHHFTVTSQHAGMKSIYAASRGGVGFNGKPTFTLMVQVPTKESGLTVTVPVKSSSDSSEFIKIARRVAINGNMRVMLNGALIEPVDLSKAEEKGYMFIKRSSVYDSAVMSGKTYFTDAIINVKYGAVIYPLEPTTDELKMLVNSLNPLFPRGTGVVLYAKPNSIGVVPSRESLEMTEKTIETVTEMLKIVKRRVEMAIDRNQRSFMAKVVEALFKQKSRMMEAMNLIINENANIGDEDRFAHYTLAKSITEHHLYAPVLDWKRAIPAYIAKMPKLRRKFRRLSAKDRVAKSDFDRIIAEYNQRKHLRFIYNLGLCHKAFVMRLDMTVSLTYGVEKFGGRFRIKPHKTIILTSNRRELVNKHAEMSKGLKHEHRDDVAVIGIVIPGFSEAKEAEIRAMAKRYGLEVASTPPKKRSKKDVTEKVFHSLASLYPYNDYYIIKKEPDVNIPKIYIEAKTREGRARVDGIFTGSLHKVAALFPDAVIVSNTAEIGKARRLGARNIFEVMNQELIAKENEPQVQFASVYNRIITDGRGLGFFINNACEADAAFLKFFTGVSLKEKPENDLAVNIVKMFAHSSLSFNDWNDEEQSKFMETVKRIRTKSYDRFAGIKMESEKIQEEFGFLRLLDVNDFRFKEKMKTWGADGLLNIFKAMKREAKKAIANKEKANVEE